MILHRLSPVFLAGIVLCASPARADGLGAEAWEADLDRFVAAIREHHPDPFRDVPEAEFTAAVAALRKELAGLPDRQVVVRLANLAALLKDGHTRLSVPKYFEGIGLKPGHQPDFEVRPALRFAQLPVALDSFSDGVFIVRGAGEGRALVGHRIVSYGGIEIGEAIARLGQSASAENDGMRRLIALDRLTLPEVAMAAGVGASADSATLVLEDGAGRRRSVTLKALADDAEAVWKDAMASWPPRAGDRIANGFAQETLDGGRIVHLRIDEIPDARAPAFVGVVAAAAAEAEARDARLVIDVRWCFGGNGSLNRGIVLAVAQSAELNQWGRTFVLTGPRTFSACQQLTDALQQYARVVVVGDPTGSRPDHFGDSRRVKLDNSGLTLRVSTIHWNSWIGGDTRLSTLPHLRAPFASADYFGDRDPAISMIAGLDAGIRIGDLVAEALQDGDHHRVYLVLQNHYHSPDTATVSAAPEMLRIAREFLAGGNVKLANFALRYGQHYEPDDPQIAAALEALPKPD